MYRSIAQTPSNQRVFGACLLSFMILIAPIASVGAATLRATTPAFRDASKAAKAELSANEKLEAALLESAPPVPLVPAITATKTDTFPPHPSGQAQPGDQITYDIAINNAGTDATNATFNDTIDANTTLVPGSLKVSPVAAADTYVTEKDTPLSVGAPGVLTNDYGTPAPTVGGVVGCVDVTPPFSCTTTGGGTVTLEADGSFMYTPFLGFTGADTFTYTATNLAAGGLSPDDTATVTITVDARPTVTATTPTNGATNQATDTNLTVTFSEPVNVTGTWFTISCSVSGAHTAAVTGGPTTYTLNPDTDFTQGETCTVTIVAAQVTDVDTNDPPDLMAADFVFSFSMDAAPGVTSTAPTNGATGVPTSSNITLNFSESVSLGATPVTISCATSGSHTSVVSASPNTTFTVNPNVDFAQNELCTVTVLAAQVSDTDTNDPPNNMVADYVFSFTTDAVPSVTATTPTNGATNQTTNTDITLTFSESVSLGATPVTISCTTSGAHTSVVSASPNTTFTVNPNVDFVASETCTVTVLAAQVTDTDSGDPPDNMAANFVFSFSIDAAPTVTATTPINGATQVANNSNISITFSESVNLGATPVTISCATSGAHTSVISASPNTTFTVNPDADSVNGELCTVTVLAAQVTDNDANDPPNNMAVDFVFSFTTDSPPSVSSTTPTNGALNQTANTNITITFSENVNVTGSWFQIVCGTQTKNPGDTAVTGGPLTFTINPTTDLLAGNICSVTVFAAQVTDQDSGDPPDNMAADYVFSFSVPPVAVNDNYNPGVTASVIGNVGVNTDNSSEFSILTNDTPTTGVTINTSGTSAMGGIVVVAADGKFSYIPAAGYEGADSFTYTISNASGTSNSATVSLIVSGMIWFINSAAGAGDGRLATPFNSVASFQAINDNGGGTHPGVGDNIFIYENAASYTGPITLLSNQKLIGQDATATLAAISGVFVPADSVTLPAMNSGNGTFTTLNVGSAGVNVVNLNSAGTGNTVRGLSITTSSTSTRGISGSSFGTLTALDLSITGSGPIVDLSSGTLSVTLNTASSNGSAAEGLRLDNLAGTFTANAGSLQNATNEDVDISGNNSSDTLGFTYPGTITDDLGTLISVANQNGGTKLFSGAITDGDDADGSGISLTNNTGTTINFTGGVTLSTGANAAFTATGGGTVSATQDNTSIVNKLTTTTGTALNVANTTIGGSGLTFRSISAGTAAGGPTKGISLNNTGTGGLTVTGTATTDGSGGIIQDAAAGTTMQRGIEIINAQNIALSNMTLTNACRVQGDVSEGNSVGDPNFNTDDNAAIHLQSATNVSLTNVDVSGSVQHGISGNFVTNLDITNSTVTGAGNVVWESGLYLVNLRGLSSASQTNVFSNLDVTNSTGQFNLIVFNNDGTNDPGGERDRLEISNGSSFDRSGANNDLISDNITVHSYGSVAGTKGNIQVVITGASLTSGFTCGSPLFIGTCVSDNIQVDASESGSFDFSISTSTFSNAGQSAINISGSGSGTGTFAVTNNSSISVRAGMGINVIANGSSDLSGSISGNTISTTVSNNAGMGISVGAEAAGSSVIADVNNNSITGASPNQFSQGMRGYARSSGTLDLILNNNSLQTPKFEGIEIAAGNGTAGETAQVCVDFISNNIDGSAGFFDYLLDVYSTTTFRIKGLTGSGTNEANVENFVAATDDDPAAGDPVVEAFGGSVINYTSSAGCVTPLLFGEGGVMAAQPSNVPLLKQIELYSLVTRAVDRWVATGLTGKQIAMLRNLKFEVAALPVAYLAEVANDDIRIDQDAGGKGWFVDSTPMDDVEFGEAVYGTRRYTNPAGAPAGRIDLLTAIEHEIGHKLGLLDSYAEADRDSIMYGYLTVGERRVPARGQAGSVKPATLKGSHFLSLRTGENERQAVTRKHSTTSPAKAIAATTMAPVVNPTCGVGTIAICLGTLKAGKTVNIQFKVMVNTPFPSGTSEVTNQGSVSFAEAGSPVLTDDPSVPGTSDETETPVLAQLAVTVNTLGDVADSSVGDGLCDTDAAAGEQCTLRAAIQETNFATTDDVINFSLPAGSTILLDGVNGALPVLTGNLVINGPGANTLTVERSAAANFRIFRIALGQTVTISGLTIANGNEVNGGGIYNDHGNLTVQSVTLRNNTASGGGGGAIYNDGQTSGSASLKVINSTLSMNTAAGGSGGGIYNHGLNGSATVEVVNSTLSGNSAANGGGICNEGSASGTATLRVINSTFSGNSATVSGGGLLNLGPDNDTLLELVNTILKQGAAGANIVNTSGMVTSQGHNLSSDAAGGDGTTGPGGLLNQTGDQRNTDPLLGALSNNGGPTQTHELLPNSPAIDQGDNAYVTAPPFLNTSPITDQRGTGFPRLVDGNGDSTATVNIGSFEAGPDATAPTVTINQAVGQADPTNSSPINFTVVFSEVVTNFATGDVTLTGTAGATTAIVSGSGTTYNVAVSGMSMNGTVIADIGAGAATDAAGNGNAASTSTDNTVTYDATGPSVTINQAMGQADPTNGSPINFTVVFSEVVTNFATGDVSLSGTAGATTAIVTGSGTTYNVAVSGMSSNGTVIADIGAGVATDALGNGNTASTSTDNTVTYDTMGPTVTIEQAVGQADPTNASPINFTVMFSEVVTDFATGDVSLSGTAGATTAIVTGSGTTYNVAVSGMSSNGTVIADIGAGVSTDAAGNGNTASTSTDNTVTYDATGPSVTINQAALQADPTNTSPINFTVVFSEVVTDFATGDVTLSGTAGATTAIVTGSGTTYNVAVSGMTMDGTVTASLGAAVATDALGNGNAASTSTDNTVTYDTTSPTVTINQAVAQADPTSTSPINFTVVFSEVVTNFATGDVSLSGTAGATTATVTGSGTTYNVAVSGMTMDGTVTTSLMAAVATDAAGNPNTASTSTDNTVTYNTDTTPPTVVSSDRAGSNPTSAASVQFTVTFSESVTGVNTGDFTLFTTGVSGAAITGVSGSGTSYTVTVNTGTGNGTIRLDVVDNDSIVDGAANPLGGAGAGNGNFTTGQFYTVDKSSPSLVQRTWVSEFGTDSGNCPKSAPCQTFNYAMTQTIAGGEVVALDSGGFGPATITKSISLIGDYGIFAGISPVVLQGVTIAAGNTDRVILRGLNLEGKGLGSNLNGIEATNFGSLYIENCKINGFGGGSSVGINLAPSGAVPHFVSIKNTEVRNHTTVGIAITGPGGAGSLNAVIEGSRIEKNGAHGIAAFQAVVTVRDSVVSSNTGVGMQITAAGGATITEVNVVDSTVSHNGSHGLSTNAPASSGSSFRLTNTAIDNNGGCGVFQAAPAAVYTVGNNLINGNTGGNVCGGALTPAPAQ